MSRPVLVTGAAGKTGRAVLAALRAREVPARALVHRPSQESAARAAGAQETAAGDMADPATLEAAMRGAAAVYHIAPNMSGAEAAIGSAVISAVRATGVVRVVYHSVLRPQIAAMPHHWAKLEVEGALLESGLDTTILQPGPYLQNLVDAAGAARETGELRVPYSVDAPFGMVDLADVAEVAAGCLAEAAFLGGSPAGAARSRSHLDPGHSAATYELVGPGPVSVREVAQALAAALDRPVRAVRVPLGEWAEAARAGGMAEYALESLTAMFGYYDASGLPGNSRMLTALLGRPGSGVEEVVRRELGRR